MTRRLAPLLVALAACTPTATQHATPTTTTASTTTTATTWRDHTLDYVLPTTTTTTMRASRNKPTTTIRPRETRQIAAPPARHLSDLLDALARCESGMNPRATSRNGLYRGAFQWAQRSWDSHVARMGRHDLVGVDPRTLTYDEQKTVTAAVPVSAWRHQFPACSRAIGVA